MSSVPRNEHDHTEQPRATAGTDDRPCTSCRGRGWKHITSRLAIVHEAIDDTADVSDQQPCRSCAGTGRAAQSSRRSTKG
jgi:DnaJ-class molecular chaperone